MLSTFSLALTLCRCRRWRLTRAHAKRIYNYKKIIWILITRLHTIYTHCRANSLFSLLSAVNSIRAFVVDCDSGRSVSRVVCNWMALALVMVICENGKKRKHETKLVCYFVIMHLMCENVNDGWSFWWEENEKKIQIKNVKLELKNWIWI